MSNLADRMRRVGRGARTRAYRAAATLLPSVSPALAGHIIDRNGLSAMLPPGLAGLAERPDLGFDAAHYAAAAGLGPGRPAGEAALHYLLVGSRRGLSPNPAFDPERYRRDNPDSVVEGYEALAHARRFGVLQRRLAGSFEAAAPAVPGLGEILAGAPQGREGPAPEVNVVVPVYRGTDDALRTLGHVLASRNTCRFDIVVVDDASPEPETRAALDALAAHGLVRLLRNERNLGFVGSVNRAMALDPGRHVVLLNSDTAVSGDWLDRLMHVMRCHPAAGTVTPLSSSATILSYPIRLRDNVLFPDLAAPAIDHSCRALGLPPVEIPTAIGFCMLIRRQCLDAVGPFDAHSFGLGYGEENDFSRRAVARGWANLATPAAFVWHKGGGAFGPERTARVVAAQETVERLHPGYRALVHGFIRRDPLAPARRALDAALLAGDARQRRLVSLENVPPPAAGVLRLAIVPDIAPYAGFWRLIPLDAAPAPNLPRIPPAPSRAWLRELMESIGGVRRAPGALAGLPGALRTALEAVVDPISIRR